MDAESIGAIAYQIQIFRMSACPQLRLLLCRPLSLEALFSLKSRYNHAKLVVGNTEVGIEMKYKSMVYPHLIGATHIPELNRIEVCLT